MKMKDSQKCTLIVILGVFVAVLCGLYVIKPNIDSVKSLNNEISQLEFKLNDLRSKQARREEYEAEIDRYNTAFDEVLAKFPADLHQEVTIMFMQGIKDDNDFEIAAMELGEKEQYYTLGTGSAEGVTLDTTGAAAASTEAATTQATSEATTQAATTQATSENALSTGENAEADGQYVCYRAAFPLEYEGSYESFKDVVSYIDNFASRMTVDEVDIKYDVDDQLYKGSMNVMCYSIESADRPKSNLQLEEIETGVDNIFLGALEGGVSNAPKLTKYDENDGAEIENSYDFYAMLNPASSDVSAKVVGQNGAGKEASVISNSDDTISTLSFDFYEVDGKNYCKYTLDNSTSYEAEITSAEDIKLLIQSSARKDTDDKAGVRITIRNSTSLPVYVKVTGDDAVKPRVQIASKTGSVKVYK